MTPNTRDAMRALIRHSALNNHYHLAACIDFDGMRFDFEALNDYPWSSGESVLVGILQAIYNGHSDVTITDLYKLDEASRGAAMMALRIRLLGHVDPLLSQQPDSEL